MTEEPTAASEGARYSYTPELGVFHAVTGLHGDIMIPEDRLKAAVVKAALGDTTLLNEIDKLLGKPWDDELETFRHAGEVPRCAGCTRSSEASRPTRRARFRRPGSAGQVAGQCDGLNRSRARGGARPGQPRGPGSWVYQVSLARIVNRPGTGGVRQIRKRRDRVLGVGRASRRRPRRGASPPRPQQEGLEGPVVRGRLTSSGSGSRGTSPEHPVPSHVAAVAEVLRRSARRWPGRGR